VLGLTAVLEEVLTVVLAVQEHQTALLVHRCNVVVAVLVAVFMVALALVVQVVEQTVRHGLTPTVFQVLTDSVVVVLVQTTNGSNLLVVAVEVELSLSDTKQH
jgi:hypothetical protein